MKRERGKKRKTFGRRICPYCKHEWEARVIRPQSCPNCKKRFSYGKDNSSDK